MDSLLDKLLPLIENDIKSNLKELLENGTGDGRIYLEESKASADSEIDNFKLDRSRLKHFLEGEGITSLLDQVLKPTAEITAEATEVEGRDSEGSKSTEAKKSSFGLKNILSHINKGRPKPKRKQSESAANESQDQNAEPNSVKPLEPTAEVEVEVVTEPAPEPEAVPPASEESAAATGEEEDHSVAKRLQPSAAASALAFALKSGLNRSNPDNSSVAPKEEETGDKGPQFNYPPLPTGAPPPIALRKPSKVDDVSSRPATVIEVRNPAPPVAPRPNSVFVQMSSNSMNDEQSSPIPPPKPKRSETPESPSPVPTKPPKPSLPATPLHAQASQTPAAEAPSVAPPVVSQEEPKGKLPSPTKDGNVSDSSQEPMTKEELARYELAKRALKTSSPVKQMPKMPAVPLQFKKKENSTSGDDKALEKRCLDWLNRNLQSRQIEVTDFSSLTDGLYLIYALENCSGKSVGKYNKKAMLPMQKLDNLTVLLQFLIKSGVDVSLIQPSELVEGDKRKLLTLLNQILMIFP